MALDKEVAAQVAKINKNLRDTGQLTSLPKLSEYYETFRTKFGPEALSSLDGEALLVTIHDHGTHDSLVYWLEYKDDDEFPNIFGSIGGGSALKFGIYRRKETGLWMTGSPRKQQELSTEEAVAYARKHRDQLLRGLEAFGRLDPSGGDTAYRALQDELREIAPDVEDTSWGRKYFHLLNPDKLEDFHAEQFQRFHLIKLLQEPPEGSGRYICSGRYASISAELGIPLNNLTTVLGRRHGRPHAYWRIGTTISETGESRWEVMREGNFIAIGWEDLGDLSDVQYKRESKEQLRQLMAEKYSGLPQSVGRSTQQVFNFVAAIKEDDYVVPMNGSKVLGIGKVTGPYEFVESSDRAHRRPVEWLSLNEMSLPEPSGLLQSTVRQIKKHSANLVAIEKHVSIPPDVPLPPPPRPPGIQGRIQSVLDRKSQVILYGPPGTGKTYWASIAAREIASLENFGTPFSKLNEEEKLQVIGGEGMQDGLVRMCSFHPAYGYEDFLEGYRPDVVGGVLVFRRRDGIFKSLCEDARKHPDRKYYMVIDEINRGDIPRIFGELISVLENDKREQSILLPVSGESFSVPRNVFIIATMNTADKSIALLDTALRRRFGFVELLPDSSVLEDAAPGGIPLGPWLDALNARICQYLGHDARNLQVGHSYLLSKGRPIRELGRFARLVLKPA